MMFFYDYNKPVIFLNFFLSFEKTIWIVHARQAMTSRNDITFRGWYSAVVMVSLFMPPSNDFNIEKYSLQPILWAQIVSPSLEFHPSFGNV